MNNRLFPKFIACVVVINLLLSLPVSASALTRPDRQASTPQAVTAQGDRFATHPVQRVRTETSRSFARAGLKAPTVVTGGGNLLQDPSFEAGLPNPYWSQYDGLGKYSVISNVNYNNAHPRSGSYWAWLGGTVESDYMGVMQAVTLPSCYYYTLNFYLWFTSLPGYTSNDVLAVYVWTGSTDYLVKQWNAYEMGPYSASYNLVSLDVSSFADGGIHTIEWYSYTTGHITSFNVDDVSLTATPIPGCVDVRIGGTSRGTYYLPSGGSTRRSYAGVDSGPVQVVSLDGVTPIIASIRDSWNDGTVWSSYAQLMGLPDGQLSDTYYFPAYNNVSLDDQIRFGNVGTSPTWVIVTIGGVERGSYYLSPSASQRVSYAGLDSGPVVVHSTGGVPIIASIRDSWFDGTKWSSYSQLMGLPAGGLSDTYYFPAYNNVSLDDQVRFGNVGTSPTWVTVTIGGVARGTYWLPPSGSMRVNYAGLDSGPVVVQSSGGVKIIASIRDSWFDGTVWSSYVQLMGLPSSQLSASYWFPAYNNVSLDDQIRIGRP